MKAHISWSVLVILAAAFALTIGCTDKIKWFESEKDGYMLVENTGGQNLGYSKTSGVSLIIDKGFAFKDLNKNQILDKYEDWRLPVDERASDLASKLSLEQIAGLMLYSRHQSIPSGSRGFMSDTYNGKPFDESGANSSDLSDGQKKFLEEDNVRHVLITRVESPTVAAQWNNKAQAFVESFGLGIPINTSSDPRHGTRADAEYNAGAGGEISMWPSSLGLAATFDPILVENFGRIASIEYRALGIATALSPQIDLATEPRWMRYSGTFGPDPSLAADMARAYVDGFQTSSADRMIMNGWGYESVNAMVKHWPGGGTGEGGRDAHYAFGKYAVYPGKNANDHLIPFTEGAFQLTGGTNMASAVMPYYTVSYGMDPNGENLGNSYSKFIIQDQLRDKFGYDGVVCTDWNVTSDETALDVFMTGKCFGVEDLSIAERHYMILMAGVDQFGGNNDSGPVLEAFALGAAEHGDEFMRNRFEASAVRLLKNVFRTGLFENPYLDIENSAKITGNPEHMKAGFEAQLKSVVMVKNKGNVLPLKKNIKVYVPKKFTPASRNFMGRETPERLDYPVKIDLVNKYFTVTDNPSDADAALVFIDGPVSGLGYDSKDAEAGGNGYVPISLQYLPYTAGDARDPSIAGGDPLEDFTNRTYKGKTVSTPNYKDLSMVLDTKKAMPGKPVIVILNLSNPAVVSEFEDQSDAILIDFNVQAQAILDIISGSAEPSALLPLQLPTSMAEVEKQFEDVPHDMKCYVDSEGNTYDFAFGMNWGGVIRDDRVENYTIK